MAAPHGDKIRRWAKISACRASAGRTRGLHTGLRRGTGNLAAYGARDAASHRVLDLPRNATGARLVTSLANLAADAIGDLARANLLRVGADRVRHLLVNALLCVVADRVGNLLT